VPPTAIRETGDIYIMVSAQMLATEVIEEWIKTQRPVSGYIHACVNAGSEITQTVRIEEARGEFSTYPYRFHDWGFLGATAARPAGSGVIQWPSVEEYLRNSV
jgi:hypothetical protein